MSHPYFVASQGTTATAVFETPRRLRGMFIANPGNSMAFLKIYTTETPTYASDSPAVSFGVAASSANYVDLHNMFAQYTRLIFTSDRGAGTSAVNSAACVTLLWDDL